MTLGLLIRSHSIDAITKSEKLLQKTELVAIQRMQMGHTTHHDRGKMIKTNPYRNNVYV